LLLRLATVPAEQKLAVGGGVLNVPPLAMPQAPLTPVAAVVKVETTP